MITSEIEELTEGSDRVFVMRDGTSVAELEDAEITQAAIMKAMAHGADAGLAGATIALTEIEESAGDGAANGGGEGESKEVTA